ncbi:MAG: hypothetical protein M1827_001152 [Pycnora praestabilis]|nr:MAG: hypothetical protein M1827_001152 [Pycnora praestabilis]
MPPKSAPLDYLTWRQGDQSGTSSVDSSSQTNPFFPANAASFYQPTASPGLPEHQQARSPFYPLQSSTFEPPETPVVSPRSSQSMPIENQAMAEELGNIRSEREAGGVPLTRQDPMEDVRDRDRSEVQDHSETSSVISRHARGVSDVSSLQVNYDGPCSASLNSQPDRSRPTGNVLDLRWAHEPGSKWNENLQPRANTALSPGTMGDRSGGENIDTQKRTDVVDRPHEEELATLQESTNLPASGPGSGAVGLRVRDGSHSTTNQPQKSLDAASLSSSRGLAPNQTRLSHQLPVSEPSFVRDDHGTEGMNLAPSSVRGNIPEASVLSGNAGESGGRDEIHSHVADSRDKKDAEHVVDEGQNEGTRSARSSSSGPLMLRDWPSNTPVQGRSGLRNSIRDRRYLSFTRRASQEESKSLLHDLYGERGIARINNTTTEQAALRPHQSDERQTAHYHPAQPAVRIEGNNGHSRNLAATTASSLLRPQRFPIRDLSIRAVQQFPDLQRSVRSTIANWGPGSYFPPFATIMSASNPVLDINPTLVRRVQTSGEGVQGGTINQGQNVYNSQSQFNSHQGARLFQSDVATPLSQQNILGFNRPDQYAFGNGRQAAQDPSQLQSCIGNLPTYMPVRNIDLSGDSYGRPSCVLPGGYPWGFTSSEQEYFKPTSNDANVPKDYPPRGQPNLSLPQQQEYATELQAPGQSAISHVQAVHRQQPELSAPAYSQNDHDQQQRYQGTSSFPYSHYDPHLSFHEPQNFSRFGYAQQFTQQIGFPPTAHGSLQQQSAPQVGSAATALGFAQEDHVPVFGQLPYAEYQQAQAQMPMQMQPSQVHTGGYTLPKGVQNGFSQTTQGQVQDGMSSDDSHAAMIPNSSLMVPQNLASVNTPQRMQRADIDASSNQTRHVSIPTIGSIRSGTVDSTRSSRPTARQSERPQESRRDRNTHEFSAAMSVAYRPGTDNMYPVNHGGASTQYQNLVHNERLTFENALKNIPFVEPGRHVKPPEWGVIKIENIPYQVTKSEVMAFLGRNAKIITSDLGCAFHIIMERSTAKTMDCYVEFFSDGDALAAVNRFIRNKEEGRQGRIGDRHVEMEMSGQAALMRDLFPRAKNVVWHGADPTIVETNEPYNSGFKSFITSEEMVMTVKHAETPHRSPFSQKCLQRTYESMISTLAKYPWWAVGFYTLSDRDLLFWATEQLVRILVANSRRGRSPINVGGQLLLELVYAGLNAPGFTESQRAVLVAAAESAGRGIRLSPLATSWPFEVLGRKKDVEEDVMEFYAALLHNATALSALDSLAEQSVNGASRTAASPFGNVLVAWPAEKGAMTIAAAAVAEWRVVEVLLRKVL